MTWDPRVSACRFSRLALGASLVVLGWRGPVSLPAASAEVRGRAFPAFLRRLPLHWQEDHDGSIISAVISHFLLILRGIISGDLKVLGPPCPRIGRPGRA